jgi:hypothetical protein
LASFGLIDAKTGKENVARVEVSCLIVCENRAAAVDLPIVNALSTAPLSSLC